MNKTTKEQKEEIWRATPPALKKEVMNNLENVKELIRRFDLKLDK